METEPLLHNNDEFIAELRDCAKLLTEKLTGDDIEGASTLIQQMLEVRDRNIFQAVGKLTRGLHNAIVNFNVDADLNVDPPTVESSEIKDASDRLNYVITMTQNAADKTMDKVEIAAPIAENLGVEAALLKQEWSRLKRREMTADEFRDLYNRMDGFLADMDAGTKELSRNLQDIILEQGFQDLTGQVLKRVIGLISDVERDLVSLVRIAGQVEDVTGLAKNADKSPKAQAQADIKGEGPQIHADKRADVVSDQDDVDDLLSSLGF